MTARSISPSTTSSQCFLQLLKQCLTLDFAKRLRSPSCYLLALLLAQSSQAASVGTVPAQTGIELPKTMAWSAYPTGTGGYSQAVALGNILQRTYGVNLRVIPGRNDVSRLATLRAERVHFSAGGSESVYAQEGILNFASKIWGPQPVRALLSNYSNSCSFTFATAADADILSVADLKGKRVTFVQGAPSLNNATAALLSYAELTWDDVERVEVGGYNASIDAILLTTETAPNLNITKRIEIVTAECAFGMHIFKDLFAGVRNVVGGRSEAVQKTMRDSRRTALHELKQEAYEVGANAVVGVDLDYVQLSSAGSMVMLVASGTAVIIEETDNVSQI